MSLRSGEGCFCSDMWDPAVTHLLWVRFLKPGHLINLSWSLLNAFPEVWAAGCGAWLKQLASLEPENTHDKLHLLYGKWGQTRDCTQELFSALPAIWMVLSYRGHKHLCLLSQVFLWFQPQGCQEQLQPLKLWVGAWAQTQNPSFPACTSIPLSAPYELHSRTALTALVLHAIIQWNAGDKSDFVKWKPSSEITSPPEPHHFPTQIGH